MKQTISVVVTTRNRARDLMHCLGSLACQTMSLTELVIIDNNSTDDTAKVIADYANAVSFRVVHVLQKKIGYPYVYNKGIEKSSGQWVAFIDDDCVADPNWYKRMHTVTKRLPQLSAILGSAREYYAKSTVALAKLYIDEIGKIGAVQGKLIIDHEILDSKNIVYNKSFLQKHGIRFDEELLLYGQGASEDCDFGMQIAKSGGIAMYDQKLQVLHKDVTSFKKYYSKILFTLQNHLIYEKKWQRYRENIRVFRPLHKKVQLFKKYITLYNLSFRQSFFFFFHIVVTFCLIKAARIILKDKINSLNIKRI